MVFRAFSHVIVQHLCSVTIFGRAHKNNFWFESKNEALNNKNTKFKRTNKTILNDSNVH